MNLSQAQRELLDRIFESEFKRLNIAIDYYWAVRDNDPEANDAILDKMVIDKKNLKDIVSKLGGTV